MERVQALPRPATRANILAYLVTLADGQSRASLDPRLHTEVRVWHAENEAFLRTALALVERVYAARMESSHSPHGSAADSAPAQVLNGD
jgi:hypothetical protein